MLCQARDERRQRERGGFGQYESTGRRRQRCRRDQRMFDGINPFTTLRHRRHNRHAEFMNQLGDVDVDARRFCRVELIEGDDDGNTKLEHLTRQEQIALKMHRVDDHEDDIRAPAIFIPTEQYFEGNALIR